MKILIMGAGALGSAAGGFLARAGHEIHLVGRKAHMDAISRDGLHITGIWGEHRVKTLHAHTGVDTVAAGDMDLVLIAVKSYDTQRVVNLVVPLLAEDALICSYQNGLGNAEAIADRAGWRRTLGARVIYGARINGPGEVEITVIAAPTAIGAYDPGVPAGAARIVAEAMDQAGLPTVETDAIRTVLWSKVAYNCALNPLSALLDVPYGALAECDHTRPVMDAVVHELYQVADAEHIPLAPPTAEAYLDLFYNTLLPPTAAHYASMREDLRQGRRTEIDALNGAIATLGAKHGIECRANAILTALVHAREQFARQGRQSKSAENGGRRPS